MLDHFFSSRISNSWDYGAKNAIFVRERNKLGKFPFKERVETDFLGAQ